MRSRMRPDGVVRHGDIPLYLTNKLCSVIFGGNRQVGKGRQGIVNVPVLGLGGAGQRRHDAAGNGQQHQPPDVRMRCRYHQGSPQGPAGIGDRVPRRCADRAGTWGDAGEPGERGGEFRQVRCEGRGGAAGAGQAGRWLPNVPDDAGRPAVHDPILAACGLRLAACACRLATLAACQGLSGLRRPAGTGRAGAWRQCRRPFHRVLAPSPGIHSSRMEYNPRSLTPR